MGTIVVEDYLTIPEIKNKTGAPDLQTVHNWIRHHRYMPFIKVLGRPIVHRNDFKKFCEEHPELIKTPQEA